MSRNTRTKKEKQQWSALLHWGIAGCVVPSVRHSRRTSDDAAEWPERLREYLELHDLKFPHRSTIDRETFDGLKPHDELLRVAVAWKGLQKRITFEIDVDVPDPPKPIPGKHVIRSLADLCAFFGADNVHSLNRRVYKDTDCGASISVLPLEGPWRHNGENWTDVKEIVAFTLQTIVEGCDATVDSEPFWLPVREREVSDWLKDMEAEADRLWHEANDGDEEVSE
jgi:hypothetical protein